MKSNLSELEKLLNASEDYQSFEKEGENFQESYETVAHIENLVKGGMPLDKAMNLVQGQKPVVQWNNHGANYGDTGALAAQFDIIVTRTGAAVLSGGNPVALPFVLFGQLDAMAGYLYMLGTLPAGVTLSGLSYGVIGGSSSVTNYNQMVFSFTDGTHTDVLSVTCNQYEYPAFLAATSNDVFQMTKIRYQLSDSTQLSQFNQGLLLKSRTLFGKLSQNQISVGNAPTADIEMDTYFSKN